METIFKNQDISIHLRTYHGQNDIMLLDEEEVEFGRSRPVNGADEHVLKGQTVGGRRFDEDAGVRRRFRVEQQRIASVVQHA